MGSEFWFMLTLLNPVGHNLFEGPILTNNYDFCLHKLLICCLLIVSKIVGKFRY